MSYVTNYILTFGCEEDDPVNEDALHPCVEALNLTIARVSTGNRFERADDCAGGHKVMEHNVYLAAANFFPPMEMAAAMRIIAWKESANVKLFVCDQEEDAFREYKWS